MKIIFLLYTSFASKTHFTKLPFHDKNLHISNVDNYNLVFQTVFLKYITHLLNKHLLSAIWLPYNQLWVTVRGQPTNPNVNHCIYLFQPEGHCKRHATRLGPKA